MKDLVSKSYIQGISTRGLRNIEDLNLQFKGDAPKHIILTGNNGVGKTTFVDELYQSLSFTKKVDYSTPPQAFLHLIKDLDKENVEKQLDNVKNKPFLNGSIDKYLKKAVVLPDCLGNIEYTALFSSNEFLVLYFPAHRSQNFNTPTGPKKLAPTSDSSEFIQAMVNLKAQAAFATLDKDSEKVKSINDWFNRFESSLAVLLGHDDFKLEFISDDYNFVIKEKNKEPYHFTELSDGYSAIISMVGDIMMRMTTNVAEAYDKPGIIIIDELETHLHVSLQKKIFPFLTNLFPNIQFVVTTHSPFILSSISNSVIYDLGNKKMYEDFSGYSYTNLIEGYFDNSSYSDVIIKQLALMESILSKDTLTTEEKKKVSEFDDAISGMAKLEPVELENKWLDLKLANYTKL